MRLPARHGYTSEIRSIPVGAKPDFPNSGPVWDGKLRVWEFALALLTVDLPLLVVAGGC